MTLKRFSAPDEILIRFDHRTGAVQGAHLASRECIHEGSACVSTRQGHAQPLALTPEQEVRGIDGQPTTKKTLLTDVLGDVAASALARLEAAETEAKQSREDADSADRAHRETIAEKARLVAKLEPLERGIALRDETIGLLETRAKAAEAKLAEMMALPVPAVQQATFDDSEALRTEIARQDGIIASLLAELRDMRQQAAAKGVELKPWARAG